MSKTCQECGGKCCRYFCFQIDEPQSYEELDDVRWYLCHEGVSVHIDEGQWYIAIQNRCKMLTEHNRCRIYEDRPLVCRGYSPDNCDHAQGDYHYDALFQTPQDLDQYAREKLGGSAYEQAKAASRAKAAGPGRQEASRASPDPGRGDRGKWERECGFNP